MLSTRPSIFDPQTTAWTSFQRLDAFESSPSESLVGSPRWSSMKTSGGHRSRCSHQVLEHSLRDAFASVDDDRLVAFGRRCERQDARARASLPDRAGIEPEVHKREHLLWLLLCAHDSLERWIARLVDRIGHRNDAGKGRSDHVVAVLRLPPNGHGAVGDRKPGGLRDERKSEAIRDCRPEHGTVGLGSLLTEDDEIGLLALENAGENSACRQKIRSNQRVGGHKHGPIGPHSERLAQRGHCPLGPHREHDDFSSGRRSDAQSLLDSGEVPRVQRSLARPVDSPGRGVESSRGRRIGNLLDADRDLHGGEL